MTGAPVCRADHVGSLLRPRALKDAYRAHAAGRLDAAGFEGALDTAVREVIGRQEAAGLGAVTDGELRRRSWFAGFVDAVEGLVHRDTTLRLHRGRRGEPLGPRAPHGGPIRRVGGIATDELAFARSVATRPVKVTLPAPSVIHFFRGPEGIDPGVYPDEDAYWRDLLAVYRAEIEALGRLGCRYVQLDEVPIALLCDARVQARVAGWGWDWRALLARYVGAINDAVAARPAGMAIGVHLCRGNFRGHWIGSGGYEPVAEVLFRQARADVFSRVRQQRAGTSGRSASCRPEGRRPRPGDHEEPALEDEAALRRRIDEAAGSSRSSAALSPSAASAPRWAGRR